MQIGFVSAALPAHIEEARQAGLILIQIGRGFEIHNAPLPEPAEDAFVPTLPLL